MHNNYIVIMAGGIGSRLWPFSRKKFPKQFQDIMGTGKSLIQQTVERLRNICPAENIYVSTNTIYAPIVREQLPFIPESSLLLEPVMRNTAPCIAYASYKITAENPNANLIIMPADHMILDEEKFKKDISNTLSIAGKHDILVTLGIKPTRPDTGYGYIQIDKEHKMDILYKVKAFTEKPDLETAKSFLKTEEFMWNAGIFISKVSVMLEQLNEHLPEISQPFYEIKSDFRTKREENSVRKAFYQCISISIDYGVMEKTQDIYVLQTDFGWSDLGTWESIHEIISKMGNKSVFNGKILGYGIDNCLIRTSPEKLVVIKDLKDYIIIEKDNILLIYPISESAMVKKIPRDATEKFKKDFT